MSARSWPRMLVTVLSVSLACSSEDKAPALGGGRSENGTGAKPPGGSPSGEPGGDGPADVAGGASSGGASGAPPIGDIGGDGVSPGGGGAPPNPAPRCTRGATWEVAPVAGINTSADERLLAMTPDERTLVFARDQQLFVVDGGAASPVSLPAGYTHEHGVSLTADGLSLIVVEAEGASFAEVSRPSRSGTFDGPPSTTRFEALNGTSVTSGARFSSPALSADGESLYYTARMGESVANVWRAYGLPLQESRVQAPATLGTESGEAKLVVGISADERTLFVLDEALGHVVGFWRATPASEFSGPQPLEGFQTVIPSAACDRIYGTLEIGGSLEVVTGTAN